MKGTELSLNVASLNDYKDLAFLKDIERFLVADGWIACLGTKQFERAASLFELAAFDLFEKQLSEISHYRYSELGDWFAGLRIDRR